MSNAPASRPKMAEDALVKRVLPLLVAKGLPEMPALLLVGVRGYYNQSMGGPGNDRGIYDDAIFVLSQNVYAAFNANVDPSVFRPGIATLATGLHWYKEGKHGISRGPGYWAFRPATFDESLPVIRDGQTGLSKGIAINIHKGGVNTTSSEGCQTLHPDQWQAFQKLVYSEMDRLKLARVPYLLIANDGTLI